jgi:hypothetical protein
MDINLSLNNDRFIWNLTSSGEFTVKSMYLDFLMGRLDIFVNIFEILNVVFVTNMKQYNICFLTTC